MNNHEDTGAGTPRTSSEDARRFYLNNGGRDGQAGETVLAAATGPGTGTGDAGNVTGERPVRGVHTDSVSPSTHVDLALGEQPEQGSDGPHILDRSFSGTYEKE